MEVAVVVPAFNAAEYLEECLQSVRVQSLAPAEVVVVDDGSTDATAQIAERCGARVVVTHNRGVAAARNAGIAATSAPWIALLDADDRWHSERLARQLAARRMWPAARLLGCDYARFGSGGPRSAALSREPRYLAMRRERANGVAFAYRRDAVEALSGLNFMLTSTWLFERTLFEAAGPFVERSDMPAGPDFLIGEDYEWLMRALRHTDVAFVEAVLVDYRISAASLSANNGRIRYGDVKLGRMIAAAPERYGPGAPEAFARMRSHQLLEAARRHLGSGRVEDGRALLRELAAEGRGIRRVGFSAADRLLGLPGMRAVLPAAREFLRVLRGRSETDARQ